MHNKPQNIIVHHSLSPKDQTTIKSEASFEKTHKERGFPKSSLGWHIGYHWIIYSDGEIRQYRKENEEGAHTKEQGMNFKSIGICMEGNFDAEDPNKEQAESLEKLILALCKTHNIPLTNIYPHRKFATYKSCYGSRLSDDWIKNLFLIKKGEQGMVIQKDGEPALYIPVGKMLIPISTNFDDYNVDLSDAIIISLKPEVFAKFTVAKKLNIVVK